MISIVHLICSQCWPLFCEQQKYKNVGVVIILFCIILDHCAGFYSGIYILFTGLRECHTVSEVEVSDELFQTVSNIQLSLYALCMVSVFRGINRQHFTCISDIRVSWLLCVVPKYDPPIALHKIVFFFTHWRITI